MNRKNRNKSFITTEKGRKNIRHTNKGLSSLSTEKIIEGYFANKINVNLNGVMLNDTQRIYLDNVGVAYLGNTNFVNKICCQRVQVLCLGYERPEIMGEVFCLALKGQISYFPYLNAQEISVEK